MAAVAGQRLVAALAVEHDASRPLPWPRRITYQPALRSSVEPNGSPWASTICGRSSTSSCRVNVSQVGSARVCEITASAHRAASSKPGRSKYTVNAARSPDAAAFSVSLQEVIRRDSDRRRVEPAGERGPDRAHRSRSSEPHRVEQDARARPGWVGRRLAPLEPPVALHPQAAARRGPASGRRGKRQILAKNVSSRWSRLGLRRGTRRPPPGSGFEPQRILESRARLAREDKTRSRRR